MPNGPSNGYSAGFALACAATVAVVLAVGAGLWLTGPPSEQRALRMDERRVSDLRRIAGAVELYWTRNGRLPTTLAEVAALGGRISTEDPETRASYQFRPMEASSFEVCAVFARPSEDILRDSDFTHQAGRQCFTRIADRRNRRGGNEPGATAPLP